MAEIEHCKKMTILQLKEDILKLKKQKLENEIKLSERDLPVPQPSTCGGTPGYRFKQQQWIFLAAICTIIIILHICLH